MHILVIVIIILCLSGPTLGANILISAEAMAKSLAMYNNKLGCILKSKGHNVTIMQLLYSGSIGDISNNCNATQLDVDQNITEESQNLLPNFVNSWTYSRDLILKPAQALSIYKEVFVRFCEPLFSDQTVLHLLSPTKFDIVVVHAFSHCPMALAVEFGAMPIWLAPGAYVPDFIAEYLNVPNRLSHTPDMFTAYSDQMGFWQRVHQVLWNAYQKIFLKITLNQFELERRIFVKHFPNSKYASWSLDEHGKQTSYTVFNSISLIDFPRPSTHELVNLNTLEPLRVISPGMTSHYHMTQNGDLPEEFEFFIEQYPAGFIVFSLGSQASIDSMPQHMKDAFIAAFHHFRDHAIFWKVDSFLQIPPSLTNVHIVHWLPQKQLLRHPAAKLFITHGGYNSLLESCDAGVPLLLLPLFLDQFVNSRRAERLGFALTLDKANLVEDAVVKSMRAILTNDRYKERALKVSSMISDLPISSVDYFAHVIGKTQRNSKYLIKLLKQNVQLNIFQYFCIDVIIIFFVMPILLILGVFNFIIKRS